MLVLDPTCGSGATAYVAEQWGRRWITMDTSRVALALARTRIGACARYRTAPYHLQLDLLQAAHFSWRADDAEKVAIIEALNELPSDQHIFLSSSVVEALQALGALEESEAEQVDPLRQNVRDLLMRSDADAAEMAYTNWVCRFDHPYSGAYCEVYDELAPDARKALLKMAGSVAPLDGCFCGILIVELASFGERSATPIISRWLAYRRPRNIADARRKPDAWPDRGSRD